MSKQYKLAVVIGRFQPFHNQHAELIKKATTLADNVIVLVGGAEKPRTPKNPFTAEERREMIMGWSYNEPASEGWTRNDQCGVLHVEGIRDFMYSDQTWAENVQRVVKLPFYEGVEFKDSEIVVVGCNKDESSFYLKMFPQWALHEEPYTEHIDATQIRELLYDDRSLDFLRSAVPANVLDTLESFKQTPEFAGIVQERNIVAKYRKAWEAAPYAPTFVTTDAVVIQSGHILMVTRGGQPGKNLLALPGGFLEQDERIIDGVIRELREETKIKVAAPILRGSIRETAVFDAPNRSSRGRTITHASLIVLPDGPLPKVKGSDDAVKASWYPLGSVKSEQCFEDHYDIIEYFKGRV